MFTLLRYLNPAPTPSQPDKKSDPVNSQPFRDSLYVTGAAKSKRTVSQQDKDGIKVNHPAQYIQPNK